MIKRHHIIGAWLLAVGICLGMLAAELFFARTVTVGFQSNAASAKARPHHHRRHRAVRVLLPLAGPPVAHVAALWGDPQPAGPAEPSGFSDALGRYTFGCAFDQNIGATTSICLSGRAVGVYFDDTTAGDIASLARSALSFYSLVVVGQPPNGACAAAGVSGIVCAQEFYPFDCRFAAGQWGPIPNASAYILQWGFSWPGCGPPTFAERSSLLSQVEALHPALIWLY